jgi:hypothetical protein
MKTRELLQLADYLETPKVAEEWDFLFWGRAADCGTVCCALGHACSVFPNDLRLVWHTHRTGLKGEAYVEGAAGLLNIEAAADFFEIEHSQAMCLFTANGYLHLPPSRITPRMVATRIRYLASVGAHSR